MCVGGVYLRDLYLTSLKQVTIIEPYIRDAFFGGKGKIRLLVSIYKESSWGYRESRIQFKAFFQNMS